MGTLNNQETAVKES